MKRLLSIFVMAVAALAITASAEKEVDVLYLNNGTVLKGHVESVEENVKVTFVTENGKSYTYPMIEVRKIERNSDVVTPSTAKNGYVDYRKSSGRFFFAAELQATYAITPLTSAGFATTESQITFVFKLFGKKLRACGICPASNALRLSNTFVAFSTFPM